MRLDAGTLIVILALALGATACGGGRSESVPFGRNGKIAFELGTGDQDTVIRVVKPDGGSLRTLTGAGLGASDPVWSPNGHQIAFLSGGVATMRANGSGVRTVLFPYNMNCSSVTWLPDGKSLAVLLQTPRSEWIGIFRVKLPIGGPKKDWTLLTRRATERTRLAFFKNGSGDPEWSPDGHRIVFSRHDEIHVMNEDGRDEKVVTSSLGDRWGRPRWSPDSKSILFGQTNGLWVIRSDGSKLTRLVTFPPYEGVQSYAWSPDGRKIAYTNSIDAVYILDLKSGHKGIVADTFEAFDLDWQSLR